MKTMIKTANPIIMKKMIKTANLLKRMWQYTLYRRISDILLIAILNGMTV